MRGGKGDTLLTFAFSFPRERQSWRCSNCMVWGTAVWAVRDGPDGPRVSQFTLDDSGNARRSPLFLCHSDLQFLSISYRLSATTAVSFTNGTRPRPNGQGTFIATIFPSVVLPRYPVPASFQPCSTISVLVLEKNSFPFLGGSPTLSFLNVVCCVLNLGSANPRVTGGIPCLHKRDAWFRFLLIFHSRRFMWAALDRSRVTGM